MQKPVYIHDKGLYPGHYT